MIGSSPLLKNGLIYIAAIIAAIFVGLMLAEPDDREALGGVLLVLSVLMIPLARTYHHTWLIASINAPLILGMLPGQAPLWSLLGILTLGLAMVDKILVKRREPILIPSLRNVTKCLLLLALVIIVTGIVRGDLGGQAFGSTRQGVKKHLYCLTAIIVYFAVSSRSIPTDQAPRLVIIFFASQMLAMLTDVIWALGPSAYGAFLILQPAADFSAEATAAVGGRRVGLAVGSLAGMFAMLSAYGVRGVFSFTKLWRPLVFVLLFATGLLGGFRSFILLGVLVVLVTGYLEGFFKTGAGKVVLVLGVVGFAMIALFANQLPQVVQRTLTFLPLELDSAVRADAEFSSKWRFDMWSVLLPQVPQWLLLGKGYGFDSMDLWMVEYQTAQWSLPLYERSLLLGDYHSGPLTVVVAFGVPGFILFVAFLFFAIRHLQRVRSFGDPDLKRINTFLLGYFVARTIHFVFIYGQFNLDLLIFTGTLGLSVAINRRFLERRASGGSPVVGSRAVRVLNSSAGR